MPSRGVNQLFRIDTALDRRVGSSILDPGAVLPNSGYTFYATIIFKHNLNHGDYHEKLCRVLERRLP